jgi:hypothetical protein
VIEASTNRERELLAEIRRLGLTVQKLQGKGDAVRVFGPGVHITASRLGAIAIFELRPPRQGDARR